ncbi:fibronectin type III domain-containing protein [Geodermatophilus ruber]|uniref:Fibronectin type III domain-containing protein n=1 Tax=Geodermatophilus ruber TaxID=504800 RepID=A0A1I4FDJ7_9ACTN|nr:fibronectin type III domain-containing protein [Geodermatophilus ruber]SFL15543.1 Fibronectin type III domain-containing protein [Geodermatophilus ruber]
MGLLSAATLGVGSVVLTGGAAQAAPLPTLPNNMVIFPDRDFMTVEGFEGLTDATARVQVLRGTGETVVGQTDAPVNYPEAGVAFEINHPGGACWGEGAPAGLKVTPDIQGGDVLRLVIDGVTYDSPVAPISVESESASGATVTVISNVPADIPLERVEGRIIQPDFKDTAVGRRDARATVDGTGDTGYTSSLTRISDTQVQAEYTFEDAATAQTALAGTARVMSWVTTQGEERAGITIAEHEEVGGPGMGGCPAGPGDAAQPAPGNATFQRSADRTQMQVRWTPADDVAGGTAVSGYQIIATDPQGNLRGRNEAATATSTTLTGLDPAQNYAIQVRAAQGEALSAAFLAGESTGTPPGGGGTPGDTVQPTLGEAQFDPATNQLTLSATDDAGTPQIYYTVDGSPANDIDMPALNAELYTAPITLTGTAPVTVNYAAFDAAGNVTTGSYTGTPGEVAPPAPLAAPAELIATSVSGAVRLDWQAVPEATDYEVSVLNADGSAARPASLTSGARTATVTGLTGATSYTFSVKGVAAGRTGTAATVDGSPGVFVSSPVVTRAQWRSGDFRIEGTSDVTTGQVRLYRANAGGQLLNAGGTVVTAVAQAQQFGNGTAVTAAVAPETGGEFTLRLRNNAAGTANPGYLVAIATDGGRSAPFQVSGR